MTPAFDSPVFRYGFLPHHSFRVCSTLHPDLLAPHIVKRLAIFPLGPCFFVASLPVCISPYTVLPLSFGQLSCVRILVGSTVFYFRPLFSTCHLAYVRLIHSRLCSFTL